MWRGRQHILNYGVGLMGSNVLLNSTPSDPAFRLTVTTTAPSETFTMPVTTNTSPTYDCTVDWGDGNVEALLGEADPKWIHTYDDAGDHQISITGTFEYIRCISAVDRDKIKSIDNIGDTGWTSFSYSFYDCDGLQTFTAGSANTSTVTKFDHMLQNSAIISSADFSGMSMAGADDLDRICASCPQLTTVTFDSTVHGDTSAVNMPYAFNDCFLLESIYFGGLSNIRVSSLSHTFADCDSLTTLDIDNWDTSECGIFQGTFRTLGTCPTVDFTNWDFSSLTEIRYFLQGSTLATPEYNTLLERLWATVPNTSEIFDGGSSISSGAGTTAKNNLIGTYGWTFSTG